MDQCEVDKLGRETFTQCMSMYHAKVKCEAAGGHKEDFELSSEKFACRVGGPAFTRMCCKMAHGDDAQGETSVSLKPFQTLDN